MQKKEQKRVQIEKEKKEAVNNVEKRLKKPDKTGE